MKTNLKFIHEKTGLPKYRIIKSLNNLSVREIIVYNIEKDGINLECLIRGEDFLSSNPHIPDIANLRNLTQQDECLLLLEIFRINGYSNHHGKIHKD